MAKVDELVVEIKGDVTDLLKKLKIATEKADEAGQGIGDSFSKAKDPIKGTTKLLVGFTAATAAAATACFIKVVDGAAMNFNNVIKDFNGINFVQASTGTIMTDAVLGAATTGGYLSLIRPTFMGCTGVGSATGQGIYISQSTAPDANGGLGTELTD